MRTDPGMGNGTVVVPSRPRRISAFRPRFGFGSGPAWGVIPLASVYGWRLIRFGRLRCLRIVIRRACGGPAGIDGRLPGILCFGLDGEQQAI